MVGQERQSGAGEDKDDDDEDDDDAADDRGRARGGLRWGRWSVTLCSLISRASRSCPSCVAHISHLHSVKRREDLQKSYPRSYPRFPLKGTLYAESC